MRLENSAFVFVVNWKMAIFRYDVIINFFDIALCQVQLLNKFHVNIITGSGVMTVSFYKGLTRNLEIGDATVWVLPNIWRLRRVRDTKCSTKFSNKMLLNSAKCQSYSFYSFSLHRPPLPQNTPILRLNYFWVYCF